MTNETQSNDNQNEQSIQLNDLPVTEEQAEQTKGGTLKYNFGGIEGAATGQPSSTSSGSSMQDTEKGVTGMFA